MSQVTVLAAGVETKLNISPFLTGNAIRAESDAGSVVHGVNLAGKDARNGLYQRFQGDAGVKTTWTQAELVNLANAPLDGGTLTAAENLEFVLMANGVVLQQVQSDGAPSTGEYRITTAATRTLELGDDYDENTKLEFFIANPVGGDTPAVTTLTVPAGGIPTVDAVASEIMLAVAATTVSRLTQ